MLNKKIQKAITSVVIVSCMSHTLVAFGATPQSSIQMGNPSGILQTEDGSIIVTDVFNKTIIDYKTQKILGGFSKVRDMHEVPFGGYSDGEALTSTFEKPWGIAPFLDGYAITDSTNNVVRLLKDGEILTIAGDITGTSGDENGEGVKASFNYPTGITSDEDGNLYVSDTGNGRIRKITEKGIVSTYIGKGNFLEPTGLAYENGILYVADTGNHRICKVEDGQVSTVAGIDPVTFTGDKYPTGDYMDGIAANAAFNNPEGIAVENGTIYVSDTGNSAIRKIENGEVSTLLKLDTTTGLYPVSPRGIIAVEDRLYVADYFSGVVFDMPISDLNWYAPAMEFIMDNNLLNGIPNETFEPNAFTNRGLFVSILYNFEQLIHTDGTTTGTHTFTDVPETAYYNNAVAWAYTNDVVNGFENKFAPEDTITRQEIVTILSNYAKKNGYDMTRTQELNEFSDADSVATYALAPMEWAVGNGIIQGSDGKIMPQATATKAEISQILMQFFKQYAIL